MSNRKTSIAALMLVSLVLVGVSLVTSTPVAATSAQAPPYGDTSFGQLPNGVWYKVVSVAPSYPLINETGTEVGYHSFSFLGHDYTIVQNINWALNVTVSVWFYRVVLISNPDGSTRPSGDEVRVTTTAILVNGSYSENYLRTMQWYNVTSSGMSMGPSQVYTRLDNASITKLKAALLIGTALEVLARNWVAAAYLGWGLGLATNDTGVQHQTVPFAYFNYAIAEDFFPQFAWNGNGNEDDMMKIRHELMGLIVYNDTNGNNIMDLSYSHQVNQNIGLDYHSMLPTSSEAMYVFRATSVHGVGPDWGAVPVYNATTGSIDWSISLFGVKGALDSVYSPLLHVTTSIDEVKFAFHFVRPNGGNESGVKVDEDIGTFTNLAGNSSFSKLSLAITYFSYIEDFDKARYNLGMATKDMNSVGTEDNSTHDEPTIGYSGDAHSIGFIKIGGDTYVWGNGNQVEQAYSNILPWFFFSEHYTLVGNYSVTGIAFNKFMYFYEACFPEWGGYSITHDPYFAVFSMSTPGEGLSPIMLIVGGAAIGVLAAAVFLLVRRRRITQTGIVKTP